MADETTPAEPVAPAVPPTNGQPVATEAAPSTAATTALPSAPGADPFAELPYPNAGDRIKAEDFRKLSQALAIIADAYALAGATFGQPFAQVRMMLTSQGYEIARVISAGGTQLGSPGDPTLDARTVIHVAPLALGGRSVGVVVTEVATAQQRRMPNLIGLTHRQAAERMQQELGDVLAGAPPITVPDLVGRTLAEAERTVGG